MEKQYRAWAYRTIGDEPTTYPVKKTLIGAMCDIADIRGSHWYGIEEWDDAKREWSEWYNDDGESIEEVDMDALIRSELVKKGLAE